MKSYFTRPYLTYTEEANTIFREVFSFLREIVDREGDDANLRELQTIFTDVVSVVVAEKVLLRASKIRKKERESRGHQSDNKDSSGGS
jgi:hypothetical protein